MSGGGGPAAPPPTPPHRSPRLRVPLPDLTSELLKRVSRSFYLSLAVLPASVRRILGLAYLFARAADTIADSRLIDRQERTTHLLAFPAQLDGPVPARLAANVVATPRLPPL